MPTLSNLNLSREHPPAYGAQAVSTLEYEQTQAPRLAPEPSPSRQTPSMTRPVQIPAEATIQSWAAGGVQQPVAVPPNPMGGGIWNPAVGIKFGSGPGATEGPGQGQPSQGGPRGGTWDPNAGIRFG